MRTGARGRYGVLAASVVFVAAAAVGLSVVRPLAVGPIGPDAAAPVIEFQRLLAGQQLEGYLSQTSKPLLTLVYGVARVGTGDWRSVSLLAIGSFALFVATAALLAGRVAGLAAATFAAVALGLYPQLLVDVTFAYGASWALLACAVAGMAVLADRPRYGVAGVALALGALARPEILAVTAFAIAVLVVAWLISRVGRSSAPSRRTLLLALGLLALPVLAIHDWALTGDPLFWATTAAANSVGQGNVRSLLGVIRFVGHHILRLAPLLPFATIALVGFIVQGRWREAVVVSIVPAAVATFFIASGARGTAIDSRYLLPIDVSLAWAAAVGVGALNAPVIRRRLRRETPRRLRRLTTRSVLPIVAGLVLGVALAPSWLMAPSAHRSAARQRAKEANAALAFSTLRDLMGDVPQWRGSKPTDAITLVLIPVRLRAQGIVDLDLPLWAGTKLYPSMVDPANGQPAPGTILYHDKRDDKPASIWASVEVDRPTVVGQLRLIPLFVDAAAGIWIERVEPAPPATGATDASAQPKS
jgi:hypothetical protein